MMPRIKAIFKSLLQDRLVTPEVITYQTLRRAVGWCGLLLPIGLIASGFLTHDCTTIQPSISDYYYTPMREVLEGTLCAVSLFLFCYRGPSKLDSMVSNFAGLMCLGIAAFPMRQGTSFHCQQEVASLIEFAHRNTVHFACAGLFFFTLAMMSLLLFTRSKHSKENQTSQKRKRNIIYISCGSIILVCLIVLGLHLKNSPDGAPRNQTIFWFETIALVAFGFSWLTKGEALLKDQPENGGEKSREEKAKENSEEEKKKLNLPNPEL